jgi:hypothetical protein
LDLRSKRHGEIDLVIGEELNKDADGVSAFLVFSDVLEVVIDRLIRRTRVDLISISNKIFSSFLA